MFVKAVFPPRCALLLLAGLLLVGCQQGQRLPREASSAAPAEVLGLDYSALRSLRANSECYQLEVLFESQAMVPQSQLAQLVTACEGRILARRAFLAEEAELEQVLKEERRAREQAEREAREAQARRQLAQELHRRQLEQAEEQRQSQNQVRMAERRQQLVGQLAAAPVRAVLDESEVADKGFAYALGQPSERSLYEFLACVEIAYPNQAVVVTQEARKLTVLMKKAQMPRGEVALEFDFREQDDDWVLARIRVDELVTQAAQERFIMAQNLVATSCYAVEGKL